MIYFGLCYKNLRISYYQWVLAALSPCLGRVHRRSLSRSPATLLPSPRAPRPVYTCGTLVACCFSGLSLPHPPRRARLGWTSQEHKIRCGSFRDLVSVSYVNWSKSKTPVTDRTCHRQTDNATHFGTSFLSVSFDGLSYGGLQNRPRRDCFYQFLSLGCNLGGCRIGLAEIVNGSERPRHKQTDDVAHFRTSFMLVSFVGLSSGGLQNRPRRDCFCQFLLLGCHLRGCRIGLAEIVNGSKRPRHKQTDSVTHFRTSFLLVSFVGLSSGGLQNRPHRDCFCQFLSLGCHLGGCRINLAETVNGSERHITDRQVN